MKKAATTGQKIKKSSVTRRKFLSSLGLAAGAAALVPTMKSFRPASGGKRSLLEAWTNTGGPKMENYFIEPKRILYRKTGAHLLPLAQRLF